MDKKCKVALSPLKKFNNWGESMSLRHVYGDTGCQQIMEGQRWAWLSGCLWGRVPGHAMIDNRLLCNTYPRQGNFNALLNDIYIS